MDEIILQSYLRGECTDEEAERVEAWYEESPSNRKILEQLYYTLFVGDRIVTMNAVDTETSLKQLKATIKKKEQTTRQLKQPFRWRHYSTIAAAFLVGIIVTSGVSWGLLGNKLSDYEILTVAGQRAQTVLPDGSKVWLNASSKLTYHHSFWSSKRQVDLTGEAYFEVNRDRHAPFVVSSKNISTCVLGTKFNVRAREEENRVVTTLFQGRVRVDSPQIEGNGYLLNPGQTLNINTDTYQAELIEYNQPSDVLLWIGGKLTFRQHSLLEITNIMEKLYDIKFVYEDNALKAERFTGEFSTDDTPEEILNVLMHTNHFNYRKEGHTVRLIKKQ